MELEQLLASSDLLAFTTGAPQNRGLGAGRVAIPIQDASAHATFYLVALKGAPRPRGRDRILDPRDGVSAERPVATPIHAFTLQSHWRVTGPRRPSVYRRQP